VAEGLSSLRAGSHTGTRKLTRHSWRGVLLAILLGCQGAGEVRGQEAGEVRGQEAGEVRGQEAGEVRGQESAFSTVIDRSLIRSAGITRFSDLLRLIPTFTETSLDGFRVSGSLGSASPFRAARWRVSVDGREVARPALLDTHPETIPVSVSSIQRVIVDPTPAAGPGGLSAGGWIHIETARPAPGLKTEAIGAVGNEVGDPGPFRYTDFESPNIDRVGPTADGRITLAGPVWWSSIGMRADQSHPTDRQIAQRVEWLFAGKPLITLLQPRVEIGRSGSGGTHRISADLTILRDMLFLESVGAELPTIRRSQGVEAYGTFLRPGGTTLSYALSASRVAFSERGNRRDLDLDWAASQVSGRVQLSTVRDGWDWRVALQTVSTRLDSGQLSPAPTVWVPRIEAGLRLGSSRTWSHTMLVDATLPVGQVGVIPPSLTYQLDSGQRPVRFTVRATFMSESPFARIDEAFWLREGWDYPGPGSGRSRAPDTPTNERTISLDAAIRQTRENGVTWGIAGFIRSYSGLNLAGVSLVPDSLFEARYLATRSFPGGTDGRVQGLRIWYRQPIGPHMWHRVDYTHRRPVSAGDVTFWQSWRSLPSQEMRYLLSVEAVPRTTLLLAARFRTATLWPSILAGPFSSKSERLPPTLVVDLTITKKLWGPRIRAFVGFRNLTGGNGRTHPLGSDQDLTFTAGLGLGGT
jgi:hypothetical protein